MATLTDILTFSMRGPGAGGRERDWVDAACAGDADAFARLVAQHQNRVFRLAGRFFVERADVEEVAQETFLVAWRKLASYRGDAPFEHWLTRVCLRCCYARLRRERRRRDDVAFSHEPAAVATDRDAPIEVERLLARLSARDRFVLLLLDGEGWSVREIAERVGWSESNVKVRAHRARRRLRRLLETDGVG